MSGIVHTGDSVNNTTVRTKGRTEADGVCRKQTPERKFSARDTCSLCVVTVHVRTLHSIGWSQTASCFAPARRHSSKNQAWIPTANMISIAAEKDGVLSCW